MFDDAFNGSPLNTKLRLSAYRAVKRKIFLQRCIQKPVQISHRFLRVVPWNRKTGASRYVYTLLLTLPLNLVFLEVTCRCVNSQHLNQINQDPLTQTIDANTDAHVFVSASSTSNLVITCLAVVSTWLIISLREIWTSDEKSWYGFKKHVPLIVHTRFGKARYRGQLWEEGYAWPRPSRPRLCE